MTIFPTVKAYPALTRLLLIHSDHPSWKIDPGNLLTRALSRPEGQRKENISLAPGTVWLERFEGVSYMFDLVIVSNWVDCAGAPLMEPEIGSLPSAAGAGKEYAQAANMARTGRANLMTNCDEKVKIKINA